MGLFQVFVLYFIYIALFLTDAHTTDINLLTNETKTPEKTLVNEMVGNAQKARQDSCLDSQIRKTINPLNLRLDLKGSLKEINANLKRKSTQAPLNFVIDTKPRTIPIKIPLVIKTANVKPGPAHYKRLKSDTERKTSSKHNSNKETSRKKVVPIDVFTPHRHKPKSSHFFEEDSNVESMRTLSTPSNPEKQKISAIKSDPINLNSKKVINEDTKQRTIQMESDNGSNETIHTKNETHSINVKELPEPIPFEIESTTINKEEVDEKLQENISNVTPVIPEEIKELSTSRDEDTPTGVIDNEDNCQQTTNKPEQSMEALKEYPIVAVDDEIDASDIITIRDQKYEECEEITRPNANTEDVNENLNDPLEPQSLNIEYPYCNDLQIDQIENEKYLNSFADNTLSMYDRGYYPTSKSGFTQIVTSPELEEIQDIYGQRLGTPKNVIDIRPENVLGRVWRRWKNTEVKIRKPYYGINRPFQVGGNWITPKYGEGNAKNPSLYGPKAGIYGYYNNINNVSPYSYSNNRYV